MQIDRNKLKENKKDYLEELKVEVNKTTGD
jgi:hypothetical protein